MKAKLSGSLDDNKKLKLTSRSQH